MHQTSEQSIQRRPAKFGVEHAIARGLTRIEMVVILVLITLTIRLLLPGIVSTRESARHTMSQDRLRRLGLALRESGGRKIDQGPIVFQASASEAPGTSDVTLFVEGLIALVLAGGIAGAVFAMRSAVRNFRQPEPVLDGEARPARFAPQPHRSRSEPSEAGP